MDQWADEKELPYVKKYAVTPGIFPYRKASIAIGIPCSTLKKGAFRRPLFFLNVEVSASTASFQIAFSLFVAIKTEKAFCFTELADGRDVFETLELRAPKGLRLLGD